MNRPAVQLDEATRQCETETGAFLLARVVAADLPELLEYRFLVSGGNADLPYLLADYHLCIGPEGTNFRDGIGTGAYALETFNPGVRAMTKKNPNFWRTDRGFVDSV